MNRFSWLCLLVWSCSTSALAADPSPWPRLGGHLGLALPVVSVGGGGASVFGKNHASVGLTPGVTFKLDEHWRIDFEFVALNDFKNGGATTLVVDPGVLYSFGSFTAGLRVATQVGAPANFGVVPIAVLPFALTDKFTYFVELDLPLFFRDANGVQASVTAQLQTGVAF